MANSRIKICPLKRSQFQLDFKRAIAVLHPIFKEAIAVPNSMLGLAE
ncbi:MAG: hypothetical protein KA717_35110 [Woronichinia naegeliana WA131]|uniref:Uncharacterized protein n=1 Tax=Woronichinia naegeliana WA131 TaxID=2824559 RepID=A0A977KVJ3_9CYAN|nr:MAG: hypothetical protein KA717_35110 [Woronichinia naegeliana WA131]